jgi:hypothetical protein
MAFLLQAKAARIVMLHAQPWDSKGQLSASAFIAWTPVLLLARVLVDTRRQIKNQSF